MSKKIKETPKGFSVNESYFNVRINQNDFDYSDQ